MNRPYRQIRGGRRQRTLASSTKALRALLNVLGIDSFRPDQLKAIFACAVQRYDLWLQLHCSAGKTLVFIAILLLHCEGDQGAIGILASPMRTSVAGTTDELRRFGIHVVELTSASRKDVVKLLREGRPAYPTVIIGTPKQLKHKEFLNALSPGPADLPDVLDWEALPVSPVVVFAVDEAHCVQNWSHSFLHSFSKMCRAVHELEKWPSGRTTLLLAMTATGTAYARPWIMKNLRFNPNNTKEIVRSPRRENAQWHIHMETGVEGNVSTGVNSKIIKRVIKTVLDEGRVVLLFVNSREKAEHLSTSLSTHLNEVALQRDIVDWSGSTDFYHSDMEDRKQKRLRTDFANNARDTYRGCQRGILLRSGLYVMVATIAFGMSISIKYIDHVEIVEQPSLFDDMVQEGLRAGRAETPCKIYVTLSWGMYSRQVKQARSNGAAAQQIDRGRNGTAFGQRNHRVEQERRERLESARIQEECATSVMKLGFSGVCRNISIDEVFEPDVQEENEETEREETEEEEMEEEVVEEEEEEKKNAPEGAADVEEDRGRCAMQGPCGWCDVCLDLAVNHIPSDVCQIEVVRYFQTFHSTYGVELVAAAKAAWSRRVKRSLNQGDFATCIRYFVLEGVLKEGVCSDARWGVSRGTNWEQTRIQAMLSPTAVTTEDAEDPPPAPVAAPPAELPAPRPRVNSAELDLAALELGM